MLGRCKYKGGVKRYAGYLAGFLIRARDLLGVHIYDPVLHVCGGLAREYPFAGFGPNDMTMDLDPETNPDFLQDAREAWAPYKVNAKTCHPENYGQTRGFKAYLIYPPYSEEDAKHYLDGKGDSVYPSPNLLLKRAFEVMEVGQKVGIIHYALPRAPINSREVACIQLIAGSTTGEGRTPCSRRRRRSNRQSRSRTPRSAGVETESYDYLLVSATIISDLEGSNATRVSSLFSIPSTRASTRAT